MHELVYPLDILFARKRVVRLSEVRMTKLLLFFALLAVATTGGAQYSSQVEKPVSEVQGGRKTIEGFWQDIARRILFARDAPASYVYGQWTLLDPLQTYPTAKLIRRSGTAYELVDLLYDDEYAIKVLSANESGIEFVRSTKLPACAMHHRCRLEGAEMVCSLENICREGGRDVLDWKGEERYVRRVNCERDGSRQAQGIPHRCQ
jgi:hypothetical protein